METEIGILIRKTRVYVIYGETENVINTKFETVWAHISMPMSGISSQRHLENILIRDLSLVSLSLFKICKNFHTRRKTRTIL